MKLESQSFDPSNPSRPFRLNLFNPVHPSIEEFVYYGKRVFKTQQQFCELKEKWDAAKKEIKDSADLLRVYQILCPEMKSLCLDTQVVSANFFNAYDKWREAARKDKSKQVMHEFSKLSIEQSPAQIERLQKWFETLLNMYEQNIKTMEMGIEKELNNPTPSELIHPPELLTPLGLGILNIGPEDVSRTTINKMELPFIEDIIQINFTAGFLADKSICSNIKEIDLSGNKIDECSINTLLMTIDYADTRDGKIKLDGGSNAAPSGQGIVAMNNLIGKGWTVIVNPPDWPTQNKLQIKGQNIVFPLDWRNIHTLDFHNNALSEKAVNDLLISTDRYGTSNGEIIIDGGTNAVPTEEGIAAMNNLISRGWTVITNLPSVSSLSRFSEITYLKRCEMKWATHIKAYDPPTNNPNPITITMNIGYDKTTETDCAFSLNMQMIVGVYIPQKKKILPITLDVRHELITTNPRLMDSFQSPAVIEAYTQIAVETYEEIKKGFISIKAATPFLKDTNFSMPPCSAHKLRRLLIDGLKAQGIC
ncbi:MAG: hypothetical protein HY840_04500 [Bacteroidetes bacterium]|nr:hypothetical protein [Bacteroidota bacterium]